MKSNENILFVCVCECCGGGFIYLYIPFLR